MKRTKRTVYYYDVVVGCRATHAQPPDLAELAELWRDFYQSQEAVLLREHGNIIYRVGDVEIDNNERVARLLIRKSDINAPDAAYSNVETGEIRFAPKRENEGGDTAAHLLISLTQEQGSPHVYLCMLEAMTGISHRHVQPLLNTLIRYACGQDSQRFTYPDPAGGRHRDGREKRHSFKPKIELRGHTSDDLARDIERGRVNNLELVADRAQAQFGGDQYLREDTYSLSVKVDRNLPTQNRLGRLIQAMCSRREHFGTGRIRFRDENEKMHTVAYDLQTGAPEQQMYIKSFVIDNINPPMALSSDSIVRHFSDEVERRLKRDRNI